jgi:hypothetical protein
MSRTTNGIGWEIQEHSLPDGWVAISKAYKTLHEARAEMLRMPDGELRVYESLSNTQTLAQSE